MKSLRELYKYKQKLCKEAWDRYKYSVVVSLTNSSVSDFIKFDELYYYPSKDRLIAKSFHGDKRIIIYDNGSWADTLKHDTDTVFVNDNSVTFDVVPWDLSHNARKALRYIHRSELIKDAIGERYGNSIVEEIENWLDIE